MPRQASRIARAALLLAGYAGFVAPLSAQPSTGAGAGSTSMAASTPLQSLLSGAARGIARGEPRAAYEALREAVPRYAGLPEFDYLLGLAALDCGEPGAAILALSFGRPILAPALGPFPELVAQTAGVTYEPAEPAGLRIALERARSLDREAAGRAIAGYVERISWAKVGAQHVEMYRTLAGRKGGRDA